jgi:molybdopterin converting factor small subunit
VTVKTLVPTLAEAMGGQEATVEFPGATVGDLLEHLVGRYGVRARKALHDRDGELDPVVQILLNEQEWVGRDDLEARSLTDGDTVTILMLMAGG